MVENRHSFLEDISEYRSEVMGVSMLSIMLFHQYFTNVPPFNVFHNVGYWGVDVFLFLSGMGLVNSMEKYSIKDYYLRRFRRLVPSCILCGTMRYFVFLLLGMLVADSVKGKSLSIWTFASLDLWFIPTIIILYLISPVLYHLLRKWILCTFFCIGVIFIINELLIRPKVGYDWKSLIGVFAWTVERLPVFSYGLLVSINKNKTNKKSQLSFLFLLTAVFFLFVSKMGMSFQGSQTCMFLSLTFGMPALIVLLLQFLKKVPKSFLGPISFLGIYSLEIYLVHEFIYWILMVLWRDGNPWFLLVLGILISSLCAHLCKLCVNYVICPKNIPH